MHLRALALALLAAPALSAPTARQETDEYDYIIVGSGPGGGPLAVNLAKAGHSVLLLEAGDTSVGQGAQYPPEITWDFFVKHYEEEERNKLNSHGVYRTEEGRYWVGREDPPEGSNFLGIYYPRGATVGGSSMINAMCTFLPTDSDWDYVVEITGDETWKAENMRDIFTRIEHNNYLPKGTKGHGFDGWFQTQMMGGQPISDAQEAPASPITQAMAEMLGLDPEKVPVLVTQDPNFYDPDRDTTQDIYGLAQHQRANGQRYSSRDYIIDTMDSEDIPLTLSVNSLATRVLFDTSKVEDGGNPIATGIEYLQGKSIYEADARRGPDAKGTKKTATARREVILSGGCFNTPQLLMLSGIGDPSHLEEFDIDVLVEAPGVGASLMDNQEMPIVGKTKESPGFGNTGIVMLQTDHAPYDERDMFLMHGPYAFRGFWPSNQTNRLPAEESGTYGVSMVKQHPVNRAGYVKLKSADPTAMPDINFNLFEQGRETDMGAMKDAIAWVRRMYRSVSDPTGPVTPMEPPCPSGIKEDGYCTDEKEDEDWIIAQTFGHHPTSTARIGADDDPMAVLDSKFRVRGVDSLRVVDASTFARIPGIFPVVATFIISQKATDTILGELAAEAEAVAEPEGHAEEED